MLWIYYGGLAGIIGASAGNDLYHPIQALLIGAGAAVVCYKGHFFAERTFKIDDPLGAVAVHGYAGVYGLLVAGFMLWGYPSSMNPDYASISPLGQLASGDGGSYFTATNIYLTPTTLSAITFNFLMSLSGGMMAAFVVSKGDVLWIYYGGLAGIIGASAGNDLYHPIQALLIGAGGAWVCHKGHFFVERTFKIDDPLGAIAVHGYAGFYGVVIAGFMLWGYPSSMNPDYASISPLGQLAGAVIMFGVLGLIPGFIIAKILSAFGILRVPRGVELAGLDLREIHTRYEEKEELRAALAKEPIDG